MPNVIRARVPGYRNIEKNYRADGLVRSGSTLDSPQLIAVGILLTLILDGEGLPPALHREGIGTIITRPDLEGP